MKVTVDFSVFTAEAGAFGNLTGEIDVSVAPQIGDSISFMFSKSKATLDPSTGFSGMLKVTDRVIVANQGNQQLALALSDIVVPTKSDAVKVIQYFELAYNLFSVEYSEESDS